MGRHAHNDGRRFTGRIRTTAIALALGLAAGPAIGQDAGPDTPATPDAPKQAVALGPLAPFLLYGQESNRPWIGETDGNAYRLINPDAPDAITYFFVGTPPDARGQRTVQTKTLVLQGDGKIGLLYGYQEQPKQYYMLVIDSAGLIQMFHRPPEGGLIEAFHANVEPQRDEEGNPAGPLMVTLKLTEEGDTARAFVDDIEIGQIQGPAVGQGDVGIAAAGRLDGLFLEFGWTHADQ